MGIYAGDGKYVHSPHRGEKVKVSNLSGRKDFVGGVRASALNKTTTKTYKVKGLSSATVKKYIKLIENGSLTKDGLKSIKNEKLKKFINDYLTWYDKAQDHTTKAEELKAQKRQYQLDKYQNYVDEAQTYIDKYNTQIELAPGAVTKNNLEQKKLKYIKQSYDYQIKIAEAEKDSLKVSQLKVEKEKELLAVKKEILQNSLDQNDKDTELLDAKYANATSVEEKNSIIDEKNKIIEMTIIQFLINLYLLEFNFQYRVPITSDWLWNIDSDFLKNYHKNISKFINKIYNYVITDKKLVKNQKDPNCEKILSTVLSEITERFEKLTELISPIDTPTIDLVNISNFCIRNKKFDSEMINKIREG